MKTILQETTAEIVDLSTRKHQCWYDEAYKEIQELLAKSDDQAAKAAFKTAYSTLHIKPRTTQNDWWTAIAERTQRDAGHVTRMEDVRMLNAVLFGDLQEGMRNYCAPRKHQKGQLKRKVAQASSTIIYGSRMPQIETVGAHR